MPRDEYGFVAVNYSPQQTLTGDGIEILVIGFVSLFDEWQGSTITTFYNSDGSFDQQYVADIVITRDPYNRSEWQCRFEVQFDGGAGYLHSQPGMFTGFKLGLPIDQQPEPPSMDLLPTQFPDPATRSQFYAMYPCMTRRQIRTRSLRAAEGDMALFAT